MSWLQMLVIRHTFFACFSGSRSVCLVEHPVDRFAPRRHSRYAPAVPNATGAPSNTEIRMNAPSRTVLPAEIEGLLGTRNWSSAPITQSAPLLTGKAILVALPIYSAPPFPRATAPAPNGGRLITHRIDIPYG